MAEFHEMNFEGLSQYSVKLSVQISSKPDYLTRLKNAMFLLSKYTFLFYPFFYFFYDLTVYHKTSKDRNATVHIFSAFSNYIVKYAYWKCLKLVCYSQSNTMTFLNTSQMYRIFLLRWVGSKFNIVFIDKSFTCVSAWNSWNTFPMWSCHYP